MKKTEVRVVSPEEERAQEILRQEAGWDGGYPIAVKWEGEATSEDLKNLSMIQASGDDHCYWVRNAVSALVLFKKGHSLETSPLVLAKRVTFRGKGGSPSMKNAVVGNPRAHFVLKSYYG